MGKNYSDSFAVNEATGLTSKKQMGHGLYRDLRNQTLALARKEFQDACESYGPKARNAAALNLRTSLTLFGNGKFWVQEQEESDVYDQSGDEILGTGYCAIGAIHKADGQAEHLARLAADLAAGELFPKRAMVEEDMVDEDSSDFDEPSNITWTVPMPDVVAFNDNESTKFPEVRKVFQRALLLLGV